MLFTSPDFYESHEQLRHPTLFTQHTHFLSCPPAIQTRALLQEKIPSMYNFLYCKSPLSNTRDDMCGMAVAYKTSPQEEWFVAGK
mmetsp:Transcript_60753/g.71099  ORF Transcript_60753/g.71099 Transcript_60753/m.71099 type:complete len:85 (-) Transcript_60753:552-806(-)